jgi:hypothetical protein
MTWHKRSKLEYKMFVAALHSLNRRTELRRLMVWARHKRLDGPLNLYTSRMVEEERKLMKIGFHFPKQMRWARLVHAISNLVSPRQRYMPRGSASTYRYKSR